MPSIGIQRNGTLTNNLSFHAEALCRAVAPDLSDGPLYILLRSELPPDIQKPPHTIAFTMQILDLILRPTLERLGRWRGRGPAMIIDPAEVAAVSAHRPRVSRQRSFKPVFLGAILHELSHILDLGQDEEADPPALVVEIGRRVISAESASELPPSNGHGAPIPWRLHDWRFIRVALHLAYRAIQAGEQISALDIIDTAELGLSPIWQYAKALGDEPDRLVHQSFAVIHATPVPKAFAAVWRRDLLRWLLPVISREDLAVRLEACGRRVFIHAVVCDSHHPSERLEKQPC